MNRSILIYKINPICLITISILSFNDRRSALTSGGVLRITEDRTTPLRFEILIIIHKLGIHPKLYFYISKYPYLLQKIFCSGMSN